MPTNNIYYRNRLDDLRKLTLKGCMHIMSRPSHPKYYDMLKILAARYIPQELAVNYQTPTRLIIINQPAQVSSCQSDVVEVQSSPQAPTEDERYRSRARQRKSGGLLTYINGKQVATHDTIEQDIITQDVVQASFTG